MGFKQYLSHQPVNADYDNYTENIDLKLLENPPMSLIATSGVEICTLPVKTSDVATQCHISPPQEKPS